MATNKYFRLSRGLLMDPNVTSLYSFALGLTGSGSSDDRWTALSIHFGSILSSPCECQPVSCLPHPMVCVTSR